MRVQIPAYTDRWMMGDRYGTVVKIVPAGRAGIRARLLTEQRGPLVIAHVRLDKSGKITKVILPDCTVV